MSNEAFWGLTLRRFALLGERYKEARKRDDRRTGEVVAAMYNIHTRSEQTDPVRDWRDFFTEWQEETEQTEEEMYETMMMWSNSTKALPS